MKSIDNKYKKVLGLLLKVTTLTSIWKPTKSSTLKKVGIHFWKTTTAAHLYKQSRTKEFSHVLWQMLIMEVKNALCLLMTSKKEIKKVMILVYQKNRRTLIRKVLYTKCWILNRWITRWKCKIQQSLMSS